MAETDSIKDQAVLAARAAEDKKAFDVEILEVSELTIIADYFVICSANSDVQAQAIARNIEDEMAAEGYQPQQTAGMNRGRWILMDYADIIVHIFHKEEREYYELERLWADAEKILERTE